MRLRPVLGCALLVTTFLALPATAGSCSSARSVRGHNPGYAAVAREIDAAAGRHQVPPPMLKAIAWKESGWGQFFSDGRAKVSGGCGIGIMQITGGNYDKRRLAADYRYNIDIGAQVLAGKAKASAGNVPAHLGADEPRVLENWYRAAYRYNGSGLRAERYADAVFSLMRTPPSGIAPYAPAVPVTSPKSALRGYRPTAGHSYVAGGDGTWRSSIGTTRHATLRADYLALSPSITPGREVETDQQLTMTLSVRNVGWATWQPDRVGISTYPLGRESRLAHESWPSASRPTGLSAAVPPGALARFSFPARVGPVSSQTTVNEEFVPLFDGQPVLSGRAGSIWVIDPAATPTAAITSAPEFVTDAGTGSEVTIGLTAADPMPGSGLDRVELTSRSCATCVWGPARSVVGGSVTMTLGEPGAYDVRVRAVDRAGHMSPWSAVHTVIVPFDNVRREVKYGLGWLSTQASDSWLGTVHTTDKRGATVELSATGTRFAVIGARGPEIAAFTVYVDGAPVAFVDPSSGSAANRRVLWDTELSYGRHTIRVVVGVPTDVSGYLTPSSSAARTAVIDAIAGA